MKPKTKLCICFLFLMGVFYSANSQQWGDYTLYSLGDSSKAYLLDTNGNTFKTWTFSNSPTGYSSYLMPGGTLVRTVRYSPNSFMGGGQTGKVQKYDYSGTLLWDYVYSTTTYSMHHDICPMANGNVLLISYELKTPGEVSLAGCTQSITMWPDKIVEVQPTGLTTGTVVWEWHAWDHLVQNVDPSKANYYASIVDHPELLNINYNTTKDWLHANGIDYNPILDQVVLSSHFMNEFYVIDHSTTTVEAAGHTGGNAGKGGDILYRWGHPTNYNATGTPIFNVVHDAHWIPEGVPNAGRIVGFNNKGVSANQSSIDQVEPPRVNYNYTLTPGSAYGPASYTERHSCNGYSSNMGNSQQLPNGNMLVCMAMAGFLYEVDSMNTLLWSKTLASRCAQAFRYESCYVNNPPPAIPVISLNGNDLVSTTAVTYQWYVNGVLIPGATLQTYTPSQNGIYVVRITDANGCVFEYSSGFKYPSSLGVQNLKWQSEVGLYPNPTNGVFRIEGIPFNENQYEISITDAVGKLILKQNNNAVIDMSGTMDGVYFVTLWSPVSGSMTKKLSLVH